MEITALPRGPQPPSSRGCSRPGRLPAAPPPPPRSARPPRPLTDASPDARVLHTRQDRASTLFICVSGQTLTPPQVTFREAFLLSRRRRQASAPTASTDHVPAQPGAGAGPALPADAGSHSSSRAEIYCTPGSPEQLAGTCGTQLLDTTLIFPTCQRARAETRTRCGPVCRPLRGKNRAALRCLTCFLSACHSSRTAVSERKSMGKARFIFWLFLPACASFDCQSYCYPLHIWHLLC